MHSLSFLRCAHIPHIFEPRIYLYSTRGSRPVCVHRGNVWARRCLQRCHLAHLTPVPSPQPVWVVAFPPPTRMFTFTHSFPVTPTRNHDHHQLVCIAPSDGRVKGVS